MDFSKSKADSLSIPDKIKKDLISFLNEVNSYFKNILSSVYIYGPSITGEFIENVSGVNILIVLDNLDISLIDQIALKAKEYKAKSSIIPRFVAKNTLLTGLDVFALDYYSIRKTGILISGDDILKDAQILEKDLISQLERDIKAMRMKLIQTYWIGSSEVKLLRKALFVNLRQLIIILSVALDIKKIDYKKSDDIIEKASVAFGYNKEALLKLFEIRKSGAKLNKNEISLLLREFFEIISCLDNYFDNWNK
jgi:hypothetical protein